MKLQQNQIWKQGKEYICIVDLQRLSVEYKAMANITTKEGKHHQVTKKEFCRLIKGAVLVSPAPVSKPAPAPKAAPTPTPKADA